jgi:hypothetical protein
MWICPRNQINFPDLELHETAPCRYAQDEVQSIFAPRFVAVARRLMPPVKKTKKEVE